MLCYVLGEKEKVICEEILKSFDRQDEVQLYNVCEGKLIS